MDESWHACVHVCVCPAVTYPHLSKPQAVLDTVSGWPLSLLQAAGAMVPGASELALQSVWNPDSGPSSRHHLTFLLSRMWVVVRLE